MDNPLLTQSRMQWSRQPVLLTIISSLVFSLGLTVSALWPLSLCAAAPFIVLLLRKNISPRKSIFLSVIFFFLFLGSVFFAMFWHALPLTWALINPSFTQYPLVAMAWLITISTLSLPAIVFGLGAQYVRNSTISLLLTLPSLWVFCEVLGAFLLGLVLYGDGSLLGAHLSIGFVGNTLADSPFIVLSRIGGVFVLSFLVLASNVMFSLLYLHPLYTIQRQLLGFGAVLCTSFLLSFTIQPVILAPLSVSAINTQTPPLLPLTKAEEKVYEERFDTLVASAPGEFIILPEASEYLRRNRNTFTTGVFTTEKSVIIDSGKIQRGQETVRYAEYFDTGLFASSVVYKHLLMPVGEYMPYLFQKLAYLFGEESSVAEMKTKRAFVKSIPPHPVVVHGVSLSTLFCNEIWSPFLYSSQANEGAAVFFNLASHNWYWGSPTIHTQVLRAAKIRATESSRPLVIANDMSPSVILDSRGTIVNQTQWGREGVITQEILPENTATPYSFFRAWVLTVPFGVVLLGLLAAKKEEEN